MRSNYAELFRRGRLVRKHTTRKLMSLLWVLPIYAAGTAAATILSTLWSSGSYSLWFPPAGLRFSALWWLGPGVAPFLAAAEVIAAMAVGTEASTGADTPLVVATIIARCLAYAGVVALVRRLQFQSSTVQPSTLRFGVAAALSPAAAFLVSIPSYIHAHQPDFSAWPGKMVAQAIVFMTGGIIGILVVAPPILNIMSIVRQGRLPEIGPLHKWTKTGACLGVAAAFVLIIDRAGFGLSMQPMVLAAAVVGVLFGRAAAWSVIVASTVTVLTATARRPLVPADVGLHLQLAAVVVVGSIAGAYSDDQRKLRAELHNRDGALLHAERLKTLRAMSVAVIHELSQPLSTLSIETNYLAKLSGSGGKNADEVRTVSHLIAKKTENLANMLRRLRTFGAAPGEEVATVEIDKLVRDVVGIVAPEARAAGVRIEMRLKKDTAVIGQEVELQQALLNLLRNAIASSPETTVRLAAEERSNKIRIDVANTPSTNPVHRKGMGVGKLIVQAIAEMHGGELVERQSDESERGEWVMSLILPAAEMHRKVADG